MDQFLAHSHSKAERAGLLTIAVNPNGTSQECSGCGRKVPKSLSERWHSCPHCGLELPRERTTSRLREQNSALLIKDRAVGHPVLFAPAGRSP
ncbi:zinc ribbon domain-containing protein [Synechococcus sp. F70.1]|uniref:zinc ribbon domain-containing protein n=1 Tax=Synechococcus sp. F70.1 TaxID=2964532 RepID=UPI0039C7095F